MFKKLWFTLLVLFACGTAFAAAGGDLKIGTAKSGAKLVVDRVIEDGKVLVSVENAKKEPLIGMGIEDFTVHQGDKEGRVISVQSVYEVQDVPINIVMVLDNSLSMLERESTKELLDGVDKVLKLVRPIDKVHMVVFNDKLTTKVSGKDIHVQTFAASNPAELKAYAAKAFERGNLTSGTYLNDGVMTGVSLIATLPADSPRVMIVFTDGEEINSVFKRAEVGKASKTVGKFSAYVIDYMPGTEPNEYLAKFAKAHNGRIKKAKTKTELVKTWEQISTTIDHSYVLSYVFIPKPITVVFDEAALFDFDKAQLKPAGKEKIKAYREKAKEQLSQADKITVSGHTDNTGDAAYNMTLSKKRADAVSDYLKSIGVDPAKITAVGEGKGRPVADNRTKEGRAKNRRVEIEVAGLEK